MIHKGISVSQDESSYRDFIDKIRLVYMLYVKNIVKIFLSAANSDSTMRRIDETHRWVSGPRRDVEIYDR